MNVVPIKTRLAQKVAAIEKAIPDGMQRAQVMKDVGAFLDVLLPPGAASVEWTRDDLLPFAEEFVEQSGAEAGRRAV